MHGINETAWFARDDLLPFGLMCLRMGWRAASRPCARGPSVLPSAAGGPRYRPGRGGARNHQRVPHEAMADVQEVGEKA